MTELLHQGEHHRLRKRTHPSHVRREVFTAQQLHREPRRARRAVYTGAHDFHHMLALNEGAYPRFLLEALPQDRVAHELRKHQLQRSLLAGAQLFRDVDRTHSAFAEWPHDPEVTGEDDARG